MTAIRTTNFNNSIIKNNVNITSSISQGISCTGSTLNLNCAMNASIMNQRIISLNGTIDGTITITSSCTVHILHDCICEKLILATSPGDSVYFLGDITKIKSITIKNSCSLYSSESVAATPQNIPMIELDISTGSNDQVYITGNYPGSEIKVINCNHLILNGHFRLLSAVSGPIPVDLTLYDGTMIKNINISSRILLTCPSYLFNDLKDPDITPGLGHDNLVLNKESMEISFQNSTGVFLYEINKPGIYAITAYLQKDNSSTVIGSKSITIH